MENESCGCSCCCSENLLENIEEKPSKKPIAIFAVGMIILIIGYLIEHFNLMNPLVSQVMFLVAAVYVGYRIIIHGLKELTHGEVKIELLVTIATFGAFLLGSGEEGALLMILFYLGEYLEEYSLNKSKKSLAKLVKLTPDIALVKHGDHTHEKPVKDLEIGDVVVVKPGDKIPVDGIVVKGITSVDQSSITGESLAVSKTVNDEVYASTINEDGYIEVEVTKDSDDTVFAKIIELIKHSEDNKAKINKFIDRFAEVYTPIVVVLAILVAVIPSLAFGLSITEWTYRALTLLVIACPCALVISTPVSIVSAITKGTKNGIIIKGGEYLEELSRIKEMLFDKTGTLTEGQLEISKIEAMNDCDENRVMEIACSIEAQSSHPIANCFNSYRKDNEINLVDVSDFQSIPGKGLEGKINGETYYVGKQTLFNDKLKIEDKNTTVIVGTKDTVLGIITLKDKIRKQSRSLIDYLKSQHIRTVMLTGDNENTAKAVSDELGLDGYWADLLPQEKVELVKDAVAEYHDVAMVGDGVNDTPSLARANVGIAMGLKGADVAIESGDIVLLDDDLSKIRLLINLAKRTISKIKVNVAFCLSVKVILMVLAILGYINLWEAVLIGDMGITLIVVGNSLLLAR